MMSNQDKKTLTALYSGVVLHVWMGREPAHVFNNPEEAADECIRVGRIMAERIEKEFEQEGDS